MFSGASSSHLPRPNGKVQVAYFTNWGIYGRKYFPWDLPYDQITHILYSFANVRPETGEVYLSDLWSDEQIRWPDRGDTWDEPAGTKNLYGCLNQLRQAKLHHRHVKVLLSIGWWTYSSNFAPAFAHEAGRSKFAETCRTLVEDYGLDGIDVDFEYPADATQASNFVDALKKVRSALDHLAHSKGEAHGYLLTVAAPCGNSHISKLQIKSMDHLLSFWNLMAYDYAGSWNSVSGHQANLHSHGFTNQDHRCTTSAVHAYQSHGVAPSKLVMGMPLYGRSFAGTDGLGKPFHGVGGGSWENGVYDYKALPLQGAHTHKHPDVVGTVDYNPSTKELVSYDSQEDIRVKTEYVVKHGLGGAMFWEASGDHSVQSGKSLMATAAHGLGKLDDSPNHIYFPHSKFDNLRKQASGPNGNGGHAPQGPPPQIPLQTKPGHGSVFQKVKGAFH